MISALREIPTVSFWLQPLAENFFTHGFDRESMYNLLIISGHPLFSQRDGILRMGSGTIQSPKQCDRIRRIPVSFQQRPGAQRFQCVI